MAKKAGAQQLQAKINNDEDFEKFLDKYPDALLLLDVYSEWCGPCLGVVNALRKIKLELGGDRLQLAVCKCDNITRLSRFRKKSEPTWLFIREQKSVNLMFGSNVPKLLGLIKSELNNLETPLSRRPFIEIEELHPEEQRREKKKNDRLAAIELKERLEREKKRRDYLMFCTDAILENLPDVGVSVFGPQVNRDMFKKINEPADGLRITCKDRRFQYVTEEDFKTINFACPDPLPEDVIEQLTQQEIMVCFWKISDEAGENVPHVMNQYVHELTKKVVEPPDEYNSEERVIPPILEPIKVKVQFEIEYDEECPPDLNEPPPEERHSSTKALANEDEFLMEGEGEEDEEEEGEGPEDQAPPPMELEMPGFDFDLGDDDEGLGEEEEDELIDEGPPPKRICSRTVILPPVWVPNDERTHAALIYVLFRAQTLPFLPPDPPPEPPHVIMAFDTYKRRDLISIAERNKADIPLYGYFTSDDADEAKFLANSTQKYTQHPASPNDKLVFKVNKRTSHMMLSLASYGATYVSPNPTIGKEEALKFFPETYKTAEQERLEAIEAQKKAAEAAGGDKRKPGEIPPPIEPEIEPDIDFEALDDVEDYGEGFEPEAYGEGGEEFGEGPEPMTEGEGEGE